MCRAHVKVIAVVLLWSGASAWSVPANPDPVAIAQPDGTQFFGVLRGDEVFHWNATEDGYLILKSQESGYWVYARIDNDSFVPTEYVVGKVDPQAVGLMKLDPNQLAQMSQRAHESSTADSTSSSAGGDTAPPAGGLPCLPMGLVLLAGFVLACFALIVPSASGRADRSADSAN